MARILSLIVALVTAVAGHGLLFWGGYYLQRAAYGASAPVPVFVVPVFVIGLLLVGVAVLTAAWSSLGVLVVGVIAIVVGAFEAFVPLLVVSGRAGGPRVDVDRFLVGLGPVGLLGTYWAAMGILFAEGVLFLVIGTAVRRRHRSDVTHPGIARIVAVLVTFVALAPATFLVVHGGYRTAQSQLARFAGPEPLGTVLLVVGVVILALLAFGVRWSGLGAIIWGAVLAFAGSSAAVLPALLAAPGPYRGSVVGPVISTLPPEISASAITGLGIGAVAAIGMLFLFGGIASVIAGRRVHHRATWVEPARTEPEDAPASVLAPE